jgi:hypothetical protein
LQEEVRRIWGRRIVGVLVCLGVGWGVYTEALSVVSWHFACLTADAHLNLSVVPQPLPDISIAKLDGIRIARYGFSFQVPWKDVDQDRTVKSTASVLTFRDGGGIFVFNPATQADRAKIWSGDSPSHKKPMEEVFGALALSSTYELMAAEVEATPSQIAWWSLRKQNTRNAILLIDKSGDLHDAHEIYKLASGELRGFQFGVRSFSLTSFSLIYSIQQTTTTGYC